MASFFFNLDLDSFGGPLRKVVHKISSESDKFQVSYGGGAVTTLFRNPEYNLFETSNILQKKNHGSMSLQELDL